MILDSNPCHVLTKRNHQKYISQDPNTSIDKCGLCHIRQCLQNQSQRNSKKLLFRIYHSPNYNYQSVSVTENNIAKLYRKREINTGKKTPHNKPDNTLIHKPIKTTNQIEVSIPNAPNLQN